MIEQTIHKQKMINADTFDGMKTIQDGTVDMILADLPYGNTNCTWDKIIDLDLMWREYLRVAKPNAAIVLTATQPFATDLINSQRNLFRYDLVWQKTKSVGFLQANKMPLRNHETVLVFYRKLPTYNPQKSFGHTLYKKCGFRTPGNVYRPLREKFHQSSNTDGSRFPSSILKFGFDFASNDRMHPTQKPIELFKWLIRTYTNEGETVLDNTSGSGTTAVAAKETGRKSVCIEQDENYHQSALLRLTPSQEDLLLGMDA